MSDTMAATARRPLCLPCLRCGADDGVLHLDLNGLDDYGADIFRCAECNGEWSLADARQTVKRWRAVLAWVDSLPCLGDE